MRVKATVSFAGPLSMAKGEERDVQKSVATPLLKCGYLVAVGKKETEPSTETPDNGGASAGENPDPAESGSEDDSKTED